MMETDPDWAPSLHLGHTDIKPTDTDRSLRRGYREQLKKNALQATETGLHQADEILERQDEVTHEATENPNQQQTDTQKAAENVGRPNTKDDTEGGRQEGQTECNLCVLRCAEMNRLLEENRELRPELDELRISDCWDLENHHLSPAGCAVGLLGWSPPAHLKLISPSGDLPI